MDKYELTIDRVAHEAVLSSMDAHGHCVPPSEAWMFMRDSDLWDFGMTLPEGMPPMFVERYEAHQKALNLTAFEMSK